MRRSRRLERSFETEKARAVYERGEYRWVAEVVSQATADRMPAAAKLQKKLRKLGKKALKLAEQPIAAARDGRVRFVPELALTDDEARKLLLSLDPLVDQPAHLDPGQAATGARHGRVQPRDQLGAWVCQHYQYVSQFPRWCAAVYAEGPHADSTSGVICSTG